MDQVSKVRKVIKREQWKTLISDCQSSGMTVRDWCLENGIKEQTYYRNLKVLRQEMIDSLPAPVNIPEETDTSTVFRKLEVTPPLPLTGAAIIIRLPQATLEIADGASQQTIQAVLLALQTVC